MNERIIEATSLPLSDVFSSQYEYHIPSYQRPYAWTNDQASELFDDLYDSFISFIDQNNGDGDGYFLGSIVLIRWDSANHKVDVIDGQQRLTTLTILLSTICDMIPDDEYRISIEKRINESGDPVVNRPRSPRLYLREKDRNFFKEYIQEFKLGKLREKDSARLENEAQRNIKNNSEYFIKALEEKFSKNQQKLKDFVSFLVSRCFLVVVTTPNQQTASRVFSVMNSRGLDLQPTDILKADIISKIPETNQDEYNQLWEGTEAQLGRSDFNDLFSFIRMIYAKDKAKKTLLEEFNEHVISKIDSYERFLEKILVDYADAYCIIKNNGYKSSNEENEEKIHEYLLWLNQIDNSDWIPAAILFLSQNKGGSEHASWFFKKLERLAAFLHICAYNVNKRIKKYGEIINVLQNEHDKSKLAEIIDLSQEEISEMEQTLDGNIYELTARRRNYIILRLDSFISDGNASYKPKTLTIEHVLPQTVNDNSEWAKLWPNEDIRQEWVHKISNLVPLNKKRNSKAQNYDFARKKDAYFKGSDNVSSYNLTTQLLSEDTWTEKTLESRQKRLLDAFRKNWEL